MHAYTHTNTYTHMRTFIHTHTCTHLPYLPGSSSFPIANAVIAFKMLYYFNCDTKIKEGFAEVLSERLALVVLVVVVVVLVAHIF